MRIMMCTDLEGVAGVSNFRDFCSPGDIYYEQAKRLLTEEVNAAVDGFFAGGADEITVVDGHGPGAINIELLDERAEYERGNRKPYCPWGLDEGYDATATIGQHAKSGTPYSHITHTGSFACYDLTINGFSIGEYGTFVLCGMELGIPSIFASGEEAFCREAEILTPGVVTAAVKRGLLPDDHRRGLTAKEYSMMKLSAHHMNPKAACKLIRERAEQAVRAYFENPAQFTFREFKPPYTVIREFRASPEDGLKTITRQVVKDKPTIIEALNCHWDAPLVEFSDFTE